MEKYPHNPVSQFPDWLLPPRSQSNNPKPTGYVKERISTFLTKADKEDLGQLDALAVLQMMQDMKEGLEWSDAALNAWVDRYLARKAAGKTEKKEREQASWKRQLPKYLRPCC